MSTNPSYLRSSVDREVIQYRNWGIPLGRRFRAMKLWFHLRLDGPEAIRERLRRDLDNTRWFAAEVEKTPDWRILAPVKLQTVCIRHEPEGKAEIVVYIEVKELEKSVEKAKLLGAEVRIPPMEYGDLHFAVIADPEGNPIGLTQEKN